MAAPFVEEEVIRWLRDVVGYGEGSWGVLTSGGVMANIMGAYGRSRHPPGEAPRLVRRRAERSWRTRASTRPIRLISRSRGRIDMLGFPPETLRVVPSDDRFRLPAAPVAAAIAEDRAAGLVPFCIAPVAGSTNTGSVDPSASWPTSPSAEGLWLHVDAAYGGAARLSPRDAGRVTDLERADSLTIDPHKWFFQPYDIGALLVKRREDLLHTFHGSPSTTGSREPEDEPLHWYQYSFEGTRRFRALKLWLSWKHLGTEGFGRLMEHNDDLAAHLAERLRSEGFEIVEPELSVVCFRHLPAALAGRGPRPWSTYQNGLQRALEVSGAGWVSTTTLRDRTFLRAGS